MILELIEPYLEVTNLILAIIMVFVGLNVMLNLNGKLKSAWTYLLIAILLFGIHEVFGALSEFGIFVVEGLYAFTEFVYILAFLIAVIAFKNMIKNLTLNKRKK